MSELVICPRCGGERVVWSFCALCDDTGKVGKELATAYRLLASSTDDGWPIVLAVQQIRREVGQWAK